MVRTEQDQELQEQSAERAGNGISRGRCELDPLPIACARLTPMRGLLYFCTTVLSFTAHLEMIDTVLTEIDTCACAVTFTVQYKNAHTPFRDMLEL